MWEADVKLIKCFLDHCKVPENFPIPWISLKSMLGEFRKTRKDTESNSLQLKTFLKGYQKFVCIGEFPRMLFIRTIFSTLAKQLYSIFDGKLSQSI